MSISTISKSIPHFLLSSLFWKLSQPLGYDQQNSNQTYCQLPIIIFPWTPKGFLSPDSFLNFFLNLYIPPWLPQSFKFIVLRLLQNSILLMPPPPPQAKLSPKFCIIIPQAAGNCAFLQTAFSEDIFSWAERGWGERIM